MVRLPSVIFIHIDIGGANGEVGYNGDAIIGQGGDDNKVYYFNHLYLFQGCTGIVYCCKVNCCL